MNSSLHFLDTLEQIIHNRKTSGAEGSYTAKLFADGILRIAQKVGEEGVETALAATTDDKSKIISESADLIFHLMVLLAAKNIKLSEVIAELRTRQNSK